MQYTPSFSKSAIWGAQNTTLSTYESSEKQTCIVNEWSVCAFTLFCFCYYDFFSTCIILIMQAGQIEHESFTLDFNQI